MDEVFVIWHLSFGRACRAPRRELSSGLERDKRGAGDGAGAAARRHSGSAFSPRGPLFVVRCPLQPLPTALSASGGPHTHSGARQSNPGGGGECKS